MHSALGDGSERVYHQRGAAQGRAEVQRLPRARAPPALCARTTCRPLTPALRPPHLLEHLLLPARQLLHSPRLGNVVQLLVQRSEPVALHLRCALGRARWHGGRMQMHVSWWWRRWRRRVQHVDRGCAMMQAHARTPNLSSKDEANSADLRGTLALESVIRSAVEKPAGGWGCWMVAVGGWWCWGGGVVGEDCDGGALVCCMGAGACGPLCGLVEAAPGAAAAPLVVVMLLLLLAYAALQPAAAAGARCCCMGASASAAWSAPVLPPPAPLHAACSAALPASHCMAWGGAQFTRTGPSPVVPGPPLAAALPAAAAGCCPAAC